MRYSDKHHISEHLTVAEIECPCGCGFGTHQGDFDIAIAEMFKQIRKEVAVVTGKKIPLHINSGCRCEKHNKEVGGAPHSYHCDGMALDIAPPGNSHTQCSMASAVKWWTPKAASGITPTISLCISTAEGIKQDGNTMYNAEMDNIANAALALVGYDWQKLKSIYKKGGEEMNGEYDLGEEIGSIKAWFVALEHGQGDIMRELHSFRCRGYGDVIAG